MVTVPVWWKRGSGLKPSAEEYVAMAQKLCQVLWQGHVRYGNIRVPLNGDTTRLHLAEGLSKTEKLLARRIGYMAGHFPGTQQVRRLMGHRHWGARVNYGDCLFFTISPNERQSSWVLKLSRYRVNDPFLRYSDPIWTRLCGMDYPELAAKRRRQSPAEAGESSETIVLPDHTDPAQEILIDLPEYKIRQEATARDPLAAVEAHRLNICLRLAWVLGVRMCPNCPRCNAEGMGCQDLYGSNMRPMGVTLVEWYLWRSVQKTSNMERCTDTDKLMWCACTNTQRCRR